MDLEQLIKHPNMLNRETLYELRSMVAVYPYYQTARLLMLKNLYLLHDATFDEELRTSALYVRDRRMLFDLVEGMHYKLKEIRGEQKAAVKLGEQGQENRTISLIDQFLDSLPEDDDEPKPKRKPTPADAASDYVSYLLETQEQGEAQVERNPKMKGQSLIDDFINKDEGRIELSVDPVFVPEIETKSQSTQKEGEESYFTETFARIYIKQGRYNKALEIIKRLNLNFPKKNAYFADQIRFLEKLIENNKNKKQ